MIDAPGNTGITGPDNTTPPSTPIITPSTPTPPIPLHQDVNWILHVLGSIKRGAESRDTWIKTLDGLERLGQNPIVDAALGHEAVLTGIAAGFLKGVLVANAPVVNTQTSFAIPANNSPIE